MPGLLTHEYLCLQLEYHRGGKQPEFQAHGSKGFGFKELPGMYDDSIWELWLIDGERFWWSIKAKVDMCAATQGTCFAGPCIEDGKKLSWWMVDIGQDRQVSFPVFDC